jgi:cytochrome c biogenesis protein CcdA
VPLVQAAQGKAEWLRTATVLTGSMVLVTALWGALIAAAGSAFAEIVGSPRFMGRAMGIVLPITGFVMLVVALGELGLIRRLLPDLHALGPMAEAPLRTAGSRYRQVAVLGVSIAATFGIVCPQPLYLALIVYVAGVGSVAYGILALGAYGIGLASSIGLSALGLRQANRSARFMAWLAARQEAIHITQGVVFAAVGSMAIWFFWLRNFLGPR